MTIPHRGQPFGGRDASIQSIADLVKGLVLDTALGKYDGLEIYTFINNY